MAIGRLGLEEQHRADGGLVTERAPMLLAVDGGLCNVPADYLMLVDGSVQSTKLNMVITPHMEVDVRLTPAGGAEHDVVITYHNGLPVWAKDNDQALVEQLMPGGVYGNYARLYVPANTLFQSLRLDDREAGVETVEDQLEKRAFGRFVTVGPDQTVRLSYLYYSPGVLYASLDGAHYALYLQKQPGAVDVPVSVRVQPPPGYAVRFLSANGRSTGTNEIAVSLNQDVLITATLEYDGSDGAARDNRG